MNNSDDFLLMPACMNDVEQLAQIERELFHTDLCSKRSFRYLIKYATVIVLKHRADNRIYGYVTLLTRKNSRKMRIYSLGIVASVRQRGIGTKIMSFIERLAANRERTVLTLEVSDQNGAGLAFYAKNGFRQSGFKFEYYEDGGHAILMQKKVTPPAQHHDHSLHESYLHQ